MRIKWLSKKADKMFEKHGWKKIKESRYIAQYRYHCKTHKYNVILELSHNSKHPNLITCYQEDINMECYNNAVGIPNDILLVIILKLFSIGFLFDNKSKIPWD